MGIYNTYGNVQMKIDCDDMISYNVGDKVPIPDGVYVGREGVIVINKGIFVAEFPHIISKWGEIISCEKVIESNDVYQKTVNEIIDKMEK